ncbi:hypothetical protein CAPTEDRAFT_227579 [Capitella teleta]|uniref:Uncharacterized protein n=1 Tax=Capitella teleta TaxID=283909 RepID=R7U9I7_CAPTE|nr:hypothetical protein CAPTEDRAFT_227579 [Capitella teleta]|eukprot:ELU02806.1 hypothetical protein CAPTEDRAFT_227579 [Capitella teleta]
MIQMLISKMTSSNRDKRASCNFPNINSALEGRLRILEKELHATIQNCCLLSSENNNNNNVDASSRESITSSKSTQSFDSVDSLKPDPTNFSLSALRLRMRLVRRWRNGSRLCSETEVEELASFLVEARFKTLTLQLEQLRKELDDLDSVVIQTGADDVARTMRLQLEVDVNGLQDALEILQEDDMGLDDESLLTLEDQMRCLNESFKSLKGRLSLKEAEASHLPSGRAELHRGQSFERRRSRVRRKSFKKLTKIEEHPLVNQVLRNEGRIRRMVHALQNGGHVEVTGSDVSGEKECAQNDVEVLERQLQRLQRWQNMAEEFKKDDIEDVEQVVSAIERHIKSSLNFDSPLSAADKEKLFIKKENSFTAENGATAVNGHSDSVDSGVVKKLANGQSNGDDSTDSDDLLNERLI